MLPLYCFTGSSSAPEVQVSIEIPRSVNIQLIPPVYGAECISGYTIVYNGNHSTYVTGTSTTIDNLDPCFQVYNFTAFGVTPGVPNGSSSEPPVVIGSGKFTNMLQHSVVSLITSLVV